MEPLSPDLAHPVTVLRFANAVIVDIFSSLVHLEYTMNMRGVDVGNQMRASYTTFTRSKKRRHRMFIFLMNLSTTDAWVMHIELYKELGQKPLSHGVCYGPCFFSYGKT